MVEAKKAEVLGKIGSPIKPIPDLEVAKRTWDNRRVKWVLERTDTLREIVESSYIEMTELLTEIVEKHYYLDLKFRDFEEYCEARLGFKDRKGWYFIAIYRNLIKKAGVSKEKLKDIGWTKAKEITSLPEKELEKGGADKWAEKAKGMTLRELQVDVRIKKNEYKGKDEEKHFEEPMFNEAFWLDASQQKNVLGAIAVARKIADKMNQPLSKITKGYLLDLICLEFNASRAEEYNVKLNWLIAQLERVFNVKAIVFEERSNGQVVVHGRDLLKKLGIEEKKK